MQLPKALWALAGAALCCFLVLVIHAQFLKEGQLAAGTCEIVTLDRDSSQPRRTIARQTARCACRKGQIAGTTRARPACVDARIIKTKQWCDMLPCLEGEGCDLLINRSGWTCTQPGGRIKTTTKVQRPVTKEPRQRSSSQNSFREQSESCDRTPASLLTNAAPAGPREWPWLPGESTPQPRSSVRRELHLFSAIRPLSVSLYPVKDSPRPWRPELSVSAAARSLAWDTPRGPRRASVGAWPHPPSLATAWAVLSEEDEVAAAGVCSPASLGEEDSAGPGGGPALGHRSGLSLCPRLSESLLFSYPFSILDRPKSKIYFNLDSPSPSESLGSTGGRGGRDMPAAPVGRRGRPRQRRRLHGHCGAR